MRFQYGTNLICEGGEEEGSGGSDADATGRGGDLTTSLAGLELLAAVSEEPGAERGRGRGRLPLVGEVGEADGREGAGWCEGTVTLDPGRERPPWGRGEAGAGVGPGVGKGGRKGGEVY